jgi:hypothetical protein
VDSKKLSLIGIIVFIGLLYLTFHLLGFPAGLFCTTFVGGFVIWLLTTYRAAIDFDKIIVVYLLTVILFIIHVYEEFWSHIENVMTRLTGLHVTQQNFLTIAAFIAPVLWLTGALLALKRLHFGYFLVSVFLFGMMFGELTHFVFPIILDARFHYMAGMYTAILPSLSAWCAFFLMRREVRKTRSSVT